MDEGQAGGLVTVRVLNGTRTSRGPGPGVFELPADEAASLVERRLAYPAAELPPRNARAVSN